MPQAIPIAIAAFQSAVAAVATTVGATAFAAGLTGSAAIGLAAAGVSAGVAGAVIAAGAALGNMALMAGISALNKPKIPISGAQLNLKRSTVSYRTMIMGRTAVGGYAATDAMFSGRNKGVGSQVIIVSGCGENGTLKALKWGDNTVTFDGTGRATGAYANCIGVKQNSGSWTQTALNASGFTGGWSSDAQPTEWGANDRLLGCAHYMLFVGLHNEPVKSEGAKNPIAVWEADKQALIDPRTGAAATTWAQRINPFVWAYTFAGILAASPSGAVIAGCNIPITAIDQASAAYAANNADANGLTIGGEIILNPDNAFENLRTICQAGGGDIVPRSNKIYFTCAAAKSIVGTITENDLNGMPSRKANGTFHTHLNSIIPRFRNEANGFEVIDGSPVTNSAFITADGGKIKSDTYEIPFCGGGATQAGKLAALALANSREADIYSISLMPRARYIGSVADALEWNCPKLGWVGQQILIGEKTDNSDFTSNIEAISETSSKYAWAYGATTTPPDYYATGRFDATAIAAPGIGAWTATAATISASGSISPIIRVTGASDNGYATAIVLKYRLLSGGSWLNDGVELPPSATIYEISTITPNTGYIVGVAYRGINGALGTFRELSAVTTGSAVAATAAAVPWTGVTDPANTRPDDNATVGAKIGTNLFFPNDATVPIERVDNHSIAISGANIVGIGIGTNSPILNTAISLNANGTINGAGGGQVTVAGIGFSGALSDLDSTAQTNLNTAKANAENLISGAVAAAKANLLGASSETAFNTAIAIAATTANTANTKASDLISGVQAAYTSARLGTTTEAALNAQFATVNNSIQTLTNTKAENSTVTGLGVRMDGVEAVNTSQAQTLVNLASADTSLQNQINVSASNLSAVQAQIKINPNMFPVPVPRPNETPSNYGWVSDGGGSPLYGANGDLGSGWFYYFDRVVVDSSVLNRTARFDVFTSQHIYNTQSLTLSMNGYQANLGDGAYVKLQVWNTDASAMHYDGSWQKITEYFDFTTTRVSKTWQITGITPNPLQTGRIRIIFAANMAAASIGTYQSFYFTKIKLEYGDFATLYSLDAALSATQSDLTVAKSQITTLQAADVTLTNGLATKASTTYVDSAVSVLQSADASLDYRASALETRTTAVENGKASTTYVNQQDTALSNSISGVSNAAIALDVRLTTAESGVSSLSSRASTLEAQISNTTGSALQTRIATEETARASGDNLNASRLDQLLASVSAGDYQNANAGFDVYTNATGAPDGWTTEYNPSVVRISDGFGGYAAQISTASNVNGWIVRTETRSLVSGTHIVFGATFRLDSGDLNGAGVLFANWTSQGQNSFISFVGEPNVGTGSVGKTYTVSKLMQLTNALDEFHLYAMNHWTGSGQSISSANQITWYKCGWRIATQAEIQAGKATTDIATAQAQISSLQAADITLTNGLATKASATDLQTLSTTVGNNKSTYDAFVTAQSTTNSTTASSLVTINSKINTNSNAFPYPVPKGNVAPSTYGWQGNSLTFGGWQSLDTGLFYYNYRATSIAETEYYYYDIDATPNYYASTGTQITASVCGYSCSINLELIDSSGNSVANAPALVALTGYNDRDSVTLTVPSGINGTYVKRRLVVIKNWAASSSPQDMVFNKIKVENGGAATAYTTEANNLAIQAELTETKAVIVKTSEVTGIIDTRMNLVFGGDASSFYTTAIGKVDATGAYAQAQNAITNTFGGSMAGYKSVIDTATTNNSSNATAIMGLNARFNNFNGSGGTVEASVSTAQAAIATIEGAAAYFNLEVAASGSTPALMSAKAGKTGSSFDFISKVFRVWNQTSTGVIEVLKAVGGYVFFSNPISIDVGSKRLTLGANSAHILWFGAKTVDPPSQTIANSIFALGTDGKVYYGAIDFALVSQQLTVTNTGTDSVTHNTNVTEGATMGVSVSGGLAPYACNWTLVSSQGDNSNEDPTLTNTDTASVTVSRYVLAAENAAFALQCVITDSSNPPKQTSRIRRIKFISTV